MIGGGLYRQFQPWIPMVPWLGLLGVFFAMPLVALIVLSFLTPAGSDVEFTLTVANYETIFDLETGRMAVIAKTLLLGTIVVAVSTLLTVPVAYYLAKVVRSPVVKTLALTLFAAAFLVGPLVRTVSWRGVLGINGLINASFTWLGLIDQPILELLYGRIAVIIALTYNAFPFMLFTMFLTLSSIDDRYIQAARDLGATGWTAFWRIVVPLAAPGLVTGAVLVFVPTLSAVLEPEMLGGPSDRLTPSAIRSQFFHGQSWALGAALTVVFVICAAVAAGVLAVAFATVARLCGSASGFRTLRGQAE